MNELYHRAKWFRHNGGLQAYKSCVYRPKYVKFTLWLSFRNKDGFSSYS